MIRWCYNQMINKKSSLWSDLISRPPRLHHWEFTPYAPQLTRPISCILNEIQMEYKYRWNRNANTNATTITNINSNTITNNSPPVISWGRCDSASSDLAQMINDDHDITTDDDDNDDLVWQCIPNDDGGVTVYQLYRRRHLSLNCAHRAASDTRD